MDTKVAIASSPASLPSRATRRKKAHDRRRDTKTTKAHPKAPAALPPGMKPELVTTAQTRGLLSVKDTKLWQLIGDGMLETVKLDGRRMVVFESIERFISGLRQKETGYARSDHVDKVIRRSVEARRERREAAAGAATA